MFQRFAMRFGRRPPRQYSLSSKEISLSAIFCLTCGLGTGLVYAGMLVQGARGGFVFSESYAYVLLALGGVCVIGGLLGTCLLQRLWNKHNQILPQDEDQNSRPKDCGESEMSESG